ncbi:SAM dependent carboxyl methyltransferase [Dillenia turbinata]|uniref:SAM dependent carboxyl methyltransferase n=1 Tax=Dillenia turbinata TaxID=194707 RepID=A0AAN8Z4T8_9MAGN
MVVDSVLHMNGGDAPTSYANNSILQKVIIDSTRHLVEESVKNLCSNFSGGGGLGNGNCISIADLGCSSGPNAFLVISNIINAVHGVSLETNGPRPEIQAYLNDLPGNDFNSIFKSLPAFYEEAKNKKGEVWGHCFVSGQPGSFFGRLFRRESLHFVHSSYALHWLSQVPKEFAENKGNIYMAETSPKNVFEAYAKQFQRDFTMFLRLRAEEVVPGGRMVLTLVGRSITDPSSKDCCKLWELLAESLLDLVSEGLIEENDVDSFNMPYYNPCTREMESMVENEGSFNLDKMETFQVNWDVCDEDDKDASGRNVANCIRAIVEPMLTDHFRFGSGGVIDSLFEKYANHVTKHLASEKTKVFNIAISLTRKRKQLAADGTKKSTHTIDGLI